MNQSIVMIKLIKLLCPVLLLSIHSPSLNAAPLKVEILEKQVGALPKTTTLKIEKPREILQVRIRESGKQLNDPSATSIWMFDPAQPKKGFFKIFDGPSRHHGIYVISPVFNGWAVVSGLLKKDGELQKTKRFWYHLFEKKIGPTVGKGIVMKYRSGDWLIGENVRFNKNKDGWLRQLVRYNPITGIQQTIKLDFIYLHWIDESSVIGVAKLEKGLVVVNYNPHENTVVRVTSSSPRVSNVNVKLHAYYGVDLFPAGENCRDGVYAVYAHDLWFLPNGKEVAWKRVVRNVYAVASEGGLNKLPFCYLGNNHFAVTQTVGELNDPQPLNDNKAMGMTIQVNGLTGRKVNRTKLFVYQGFPPLNVPVEWWAKDMKPDPKTHPNNIAKKKFSFTHYTFKVQRI